MITSLHRYWTLLAAYLKPHRGQVVTLGLLLVGTTATQLLNPQVVRRFIDQAQSSSPLNALLIAAALFVAVATVEQILSVLTAYVSELLAWTAMNRLREDLTQHCLKLDMTFHSTHTPGEMIERIDGDINSLANFFSQFVMALMLSILLLIGVLVALWGTDWRIGLLLTLLSVLALVALYRLQQISVPYWQRVRQASADLFGFLEERLAGIEEIRSSGAATYVLRGLYQMLRQQLAAEYRALWLQVMARCLTFLIFGLAYAIAYWVGAQLVQGQGASVGMLYTVFYYLGLLGGPLWQIVNQLADLQKAGASLERVVELLHIPSGIRDGFEDLSFADPVEVEFDQVYFQYVADKDTVLENVSFRLAPGRVLGLLGRTGSGKTTITRLLCRLYEPTSGTIRLGNGQGASKALHTLRLASLRERIGMVPQDVQLFHATVRDNLTLFDERVSDDQIWNVIRDLELEEWFARFPLGLDTILASEGTTLSAGEAQLLAFLRVFLFNPSLVILDEASSRLDPVTERLIERAMKKLFENRTGIVIAHRLQTVQSADDILILEDGRVREYGSRNELVNNQQSRFAELLRLGMGSEVVI